MSRFHSLLISRWASPVFLIPFLLMLAVHQQLGLSDALLIADEPGTRPAHGYNLLLGLSMNYFAAAALLHLIAASQRRLSWVAFKLAVGLGLLVVGLMTL